MCPWCCSSPNEFKYPHDLRRHIRGQHSHQHSSIPQKLLATSNLAYCCTNPKTFLSIEPATEYSSEEAILMRFLISKMAISHNTSRVGEDLSKAHFNPNILSDNKLNARLLRMMTSCQVPSIPSGGNWLHTPDALDQTSIILGISKEYIRTTERQTLPSFKTARIASLISSTQPVSTFNPTTSTYTTPSSSTYSHPEMHQFKPITTSNSAALPMSSLTESMPLNLNDLRSPTPISISEPLVDVPTTPDLNTPPNRSPHQKSATTVTLNGDSHDHSKPPASGIPTSNKRFTDSSITETTALPATIWNDHLNETTTPLSPSLLPSATSLFGIATFNATSPFSDINTPVTQSPSQDHLVTVPHLSDNTNPTGRSVPPTTDTQYSIFTFQETTDAPNTNNFPPEYISTPLTSTKLIESSAKSLLFTGRIPLLPPDKRDWTSIKPQSITLGPGLNGPHPTGKL
ncbi:hypothetical protein MAR_034153 [Mya arenaria]|uniref:C2H2-type domain-containing protein n=1 Tax=Mya arenaria TaxID=6604 RepID=A0ABY7GET8_MYAAR|nr:hypothetical protein MAR_034153 [Mya arenaria]